MESGIQGLKYGFNRMGTGIQVVESGIHRMETTIEIVESGIQREGNLESQEWDLVSIELSYGLFKVT